MRIVLAAALLIGFGVSAAQAQTPTSCMGWSQACHQECVKVNAGKNCHNNCQDKAAVCMQTGTYHSDYGKDYPNMQRQ
jgi:hypothetical protein